jgi:glycosyltransferase involved in cell wall biosynthesis
MMSDYRVSVVIPAKNRAELLFECLRGLAEQSLGRDQFEVVLVDDCTPEPLEGVAERGRSELGLTIRYARTADSHGPAPARNLGASIGAAPMLAFTDSDCRPHPDWLVAGLAAFADPNVALVAGPCLPKPGQAVKLTCKDHFQIDEHPSYPTMNVFYPRAVFDKLGGFDTSLCVRDPLGRAVESADMDLAWRVIKAGYAKRFVREAIVYHEVENLGVAKYVLEGTRYLFLPEIVRRYPQLRSELLTARIFVQPAMWMVHATFAVAILAATVQPWLLLLPPMMLLGRAVARTQSLRPGPLMWFCASACLQLPRFLVMTLALIYGSVRYRCLVL